MHYVIGDVHGCLPALERVLTKIQPGAGDTVLFVGDYIDIGPDPVGVLRRVRGLEEETGAMVIPLRGDREELMLGGMSHRVEETEALPWVRGERGTNWWGIWQERGGTATAEALHGLPAEEFEELMGFVLQMAPAWAGVVAGRSVLVTHAGIDPIAESLEDQTRESLLWARDWEEVYLERLREQGAECSPWEQILYGHRPVGARAGIANGPLVNVDGGAAYGGQLIAYRIEDGAVFSTPGTEMKR